MGLKILCAGGSKEEKEVVETAVRAGIGTRPSAETWTVSLVKIGRQWSVTLDGPEKTSPRATFIAPPGGLREAISDSLARHSGAGGSPGRSAAASSAGARLPAGAAAPGERRNGYTCAQCGKAFVVSFEAEGGEAEETVPAACPHCWQILNVKVGLSAAVNNDYRVEKT